MSAPPRQTLLDWFNAIVLWLVLGFSVGWYYVALHFRGSAWPLPLPEALGGLAAYYFSQTAMHAPLQVIHWLVLFPVAGVAWVGLLSLTAPYFGGRNLSFSWSLWRFSVATLPLSLPGPLLAWSAGTRRGPWSLDAMVQAGLRMDGLTPPAWLTPCYVGLALAALGLQIHAHRKVFQLRGAAHRQHLLVSGVLFMLLSTGFALFLAYPLRYFFEGELYHSAF